MIPEVDTELFEKWNKVARAIAFAVKCHATANSLACFSVFTFNFMLTLHEL